MRQFRFESENVYIQFSNLSYTKPLNKSYKRDVGFMKHQDLHKNCLVIGKSLFIFPYITNI